MSDIYAAELNPSKAEAVAVHLSSRFHATIGASDVRMLTSFRFDDPAGAVGCETHIVAVTLPDRGEVVAQVPFTYRGAVLGGAPSDALVTTMDHSVLGDRWVYDAVYDPIYVTELLLSITDAGSAAHQFALEDDGSRTPLTEGLANVRGTGPGSDLVDASRIASPSSAGEAVQPDGSVLPEVERTGDRTIMRLRGAAVELLDLLDTGAGEQPSDVKAPDAGGPGAAVDSGQLVATWSGQESPVVLARVVL